MKLVIDNSNSFNALKSDFKFFFTNLPKTKNTNNSGSERTENSNSIDPKCTRPIDDPVSSDASSLNKNCSDKLGSGAIMPTLDTSKQLGGQLLSPNEINVSMRSQRFQFQILAKVIFVLIFLYISPFHIRFVQHTIYRQRHLSQ